MGRIREKQSNFDEASDFFRRRLELTPNAAKGRRDLGRCYRKMGNLDGAQEALKLALLRSPYDPLILHEMAMMEDARGHRTQAILHLKRALKVWAQADSSFAPARESREKLAAWHEAN